MNSGWPASYGRVRRRFAEVIGDRPPIESRLADWLWQRISPDRYALEWRLPEWLGTSFGLDSETRLRFVESTVLGLAALRLRDDVADGEAPSSDSATAERLAARLLDAALDPYRAHFDSRSPVWARIGLWLQQWEARETAADADLARRAVPIKIPAFATSILCRRQAGFAGLERCLDAAIAGMVMFDQLRDWQADVRAGRRNSFAARVLGSDRGSVDAERELLRELLAGDALPRYAASIDRRMREAAILAAEVGIPDLEAHLKWLGGEMNVYSERLRSDYRGIAERTAALLDPRAVTPRRGAVGAEGGPNGA